MKKGYLIGKLVRGDKMQRTCIRVSGMRCLDCESLVRDILEDQEGIMEAKVAYKDNRVVVYFDLDKIGVKQIKDLIAAEGYRVG